MEDNRKKTGAENLPLDEQELDQAAGGAMQRYAVDAKPCKSANCNTLTTNPTGFCEACLEKLNRQGIFPPV